ncbi:hypothetical protein [Ensifer sesbaniae]|uniref:hypothetical protein n=1 Tax=Ensifer sesbaniae TaxID=1214071 RepID=UPI00156A4798|nr:hypothetical protein [Ensifer sesbaniae]
MKRFPPPAVVPADVLYNTGGIDEGISDVCGGKVAGALRRYSEGLQHVFDAVMPAVHVCSRMSRVSME